MDGPNINLVHSNSEAPVMKSIDIDENEALLKPDIEEVPFLKEPWTLPKILAIIDNVSTGKYINT